MKVSNILSLSVKNIFLKKFAYLKVLAGFFFAFLIIFIVLFYSGSLSIAYNDYENNRFDRLTYDIYGELTEAQEKEIRAMEQVTGITACITHSSPYREEVTVEIGGEEFSVNQREFTVLSKHVKSGSDASVNINIEKAFNSLTGEQLINFGNDLKVEGDMIISESLLNFLGITAREGLLGKNVKISGSYTLTVLNEDGEEEEEFISFERSGKICGILNGKLYDAYMNDDFTFNYSYDLIDFMKDGEEASISEVCLKSFTGNEEFFAKMEEMFPKGSGIRVNFFGGSILEEMKTVEGQEMLCNRFLSIICTVLLAVIAIYVASNQYYLLIKNSVFYGILKANGVSNREVFLMHMFELAITLIVALILAFGVSVGVFFVVKELFYSLMYIELNFSAGVAVGSFIGFFVLCVLLALAITLFVYNKILKKPPVGLLKK